MSTGTHANGSMTASILSAQRAKEVLAELVRARTQVQLAPGECFLKPCVWGVLTEAGQQKLVMEIERVGVPLEQLRGVPCLYATVELRAGRYFFDANLLSSANDWHSGAIVEFDCPPIIAVEERRRSPRRQFKQASTATLAVVDGSTERSLQASVLNVSLHGMACKLGEKDAAGLSVGTRLHVDIRIGGLPEQFEVIAVIANVIPAGSPSNVVLGMEFVEKPSQRFCDAIRTRMIDPPDGHD